MRRYWLGLAFVIVAACAQAADIQTTSDALVDSDHDGVPDVRDRCPSTPPSALVGANGCPIDDDGDGVPNYLDKCPGTPAGTLVDATGCPSQARTNWSRQSVVVLFDKGSTTPNEIFIPELEKIASMARHLRGGWLEIRGYADASEAPGLSNQRAQAVADLLVSRFGISRQSIAARGYGLPTEGDHASVAGAAHDRRIVVTLVLSPPGAVQASQANVPSGPVAAPVVAGHRYIFLYPSDRSEPSAAFDPILAAIGKMASAVPGYTIAVEGHAAIEEGAGLAQERAEALRVALVDRYGIKASHTLSRLAGGGDPACKLNRCVIVLLQSPDDVFVGFPLEGLQQYAEHGDAAAQFQLALRYFGGKGVPNDNRLGNQWFRKALEQGDAAAIKAVVDIIGRRGPSPFPWEDIERFLTSAAKQGNPMAMLGLGQLYELDNYPGISQDKLMAAKSYQAAAEKGIPYAAYRLARMYVYTAHDYQTAASWLERGVGNGSWRGAEVLSLMYGSGTGVGQDGAKAQMWRNKVMSLTHGKPLPAAEIAALCKEFNLPVPADVRVALSKGGEPAPRAVEDESTLGGGPASASWDLQGAAPAIGVCNLSMGRSGRSVCDAPQ